MAQTTFKIESPVKIDENKAKRIALEKDAKTFSFHVAANTNEILTLTGEIWERPWAGKGRTGTMLFVGAIRSDERTEILVPLHFLRSKILHEESGDKIYPACFPNDARFEDLIDSIKKGKKIKLIRNPYTFPGNTSPRDVETVIWEE